MPPVPEQYLAAVCTGLSGGINTPFSRSNRCKGTDGKKLLDMKERQLHLLSSPNTAGDTTMKRLFIALFVAAALLLGTPAVRAGIVNCIVCGNTNLGSATISYAVIPGIDFNTDIVAHGIGFLGAVPGGTLEAIPYNTAPTDFVYLYQLLGCHGQPVSGRRSGDQLR